MRSAIILVSCLAAACASTSSSNGPSADQSPRQARKAARLAAAQPAGPSVDCVEINRIRSTDVLSERVIDFELINGQVLRNTLPYSCPGLAFEEAFSYETSLSRLCSVDVITVLQRAGGVRRGASCGLGSFQPVTFPGS